MVSSLTAQVPEAADAAPDRRRDDRLSPVKLDGDGFTPPAPTPSFGSESDAILADPGFTPAQIQTLVDEGVTHRGRPAN